MDIALTEEGSQRAVKLKEEFEAFEAECLSCLDDEEQVQLLGLLDRVADHWRGMDRKEVRE
jgi:DNA-binding MarR family transcriptional regulator